MLAILLAVCMIVPMAACGKDKEPNKDGAATTTVQQAEVTDGNGESTEGETTTVAPLGNGSTNYGLIDNQAYLAGAGTSDPRAAICYAMVESAYNTLNAFTPLVPQPQKYKDAVCKVLDSGKLKSPAGSFSSNMGSVSHTGPVMANKVCDGEGVASVLKANKSYIQQLLEAACK